MDPPLSPITKKSTTSWVSVVQNKQSLFKYEFEIKHSDGQRLVEVPDEIFEDALPLWEDFIIGRFLSTAPHIAKVHVIVNKIWFESDSSQKLDVFVGNSTTVKFRIRNPQIRARVLRRGMWNIADIPMVVSKWSLIAEETLPEVKPVPL